MDTCANGDRSVAVCGLTSWAYFSVYNIIPFPPFHEPCAESLARKKKVATLGAGINLASVSPFLQLTNGMSFLPRGLVFGLVFRVSIYYAPGGVVV